MSRVRPKYILARRVAEELIGREAELKRLYEHLCGASGSGGLYLLSTPGAGASELLRQAFDRLFNDAGDVIPIYFAFDRRDRNISHASLRFASEFLAQSIAFGRNEPGLVFSSSGLDQLADLVAPRDSAWLDDLISATSSIDLTADAKFVADTCFALPMRAAAYGKRIVVMLDALHEAEYLDNSAGSVDAIKKQWASADFRFILSAHRRSFGKEFDLPRLMLGMPSDVSARRLAKSIAAKHSVTINDESRDLLALQTGNAPRVIDAVIRRAASEDISLDQFANVQRAYAEELFAGGIGAYFDGVISAAASSSGSEQRLITILNDSIVRKTPLIPLDNWRKRFEMNDEKFARMIDLLNIEELIRVTSNRVEVMHKNIVFADHVRARYRLEIKGDERARVYAEELTRFTNRASGLMARHYRSAASLDVRELLTRFERRDVPAALLDYRKFAEKYKGRPESDIKADLQSDTERIDLPSIIFCAHTESFYPQIRDHIDRERSAVGIGFKTGSNDENDVVAWLVAEVDSKLEAERELAEFWLDRMEAAALMCDLSKYRIWLIAPEGFSNDALDAISRRNGYGSCRRQSELLRRFLEMQPMMKPESKGDNYRITIPMGGDTELVAAHILEDIARKHGFQSGVTNQIKTAIVEACINASEHSLSPDGQIRLSFNVAADRINITVANRGLRLTDHLPVENAETKARRGWGLKLMERLMDEVRLEQTDDGTRITMSKLLAA